MESFSKGGSTSGRAPKRSSWRPRRARGPSVTVRATRTPANSRCWIWVEAKNWAKVERDFSCCGGKLESVEKRQNNPLRPGVLLSVYLWDIIIKPNPLTKSLSNSLAQSPNLIPSLIPYPNPFTNLLA